MTGLGRILPLKRREKRSTAHFAMNLPAVLLFIYFSTAYGLYCKVGGAMVHVKGAIGTRVTPVRTERCPDAFNIRGFPLTSELCARLEYISSHLEPSEGTGYYCPSLTRDLCKNMRDGDCEDFVGTNYGLTGRSKKCCTSDSEFGGLPFLLQENSHSSSNSGLIIGISVGAVVLVILLIVAGVLVYFFWYKKRKMAAAGKGGKQETQKGAAVAAQKPSAYCG